MQLDFHWRGAAWADLPSSDLDVSILLYGLDKTRRARPRDHSLPILGDLRQPDLFSRSGFWDLWLLLNMFAGPEDRWRIETFWRPRSVTKRIAITATNVQSLDVVTVGLIASLDVEREPEPSRDQTVVFSFRLYPQFRMPPVSRILGAARYTHLVSWQPLPAYWLGGSTPVRWT